MLRFILLLQLCIFVYGKPAGESEILSYNNKIDEQGYNFQFQTSDGTFRQEQGVLVPSKEDTNLVVNGKFSFILPDGKTVDVTYLADEGGYQPRVIIGGGDGGAGLRLSGGLEIPQSDPLASAAIASLAGGGLGR